LALAFCLNFTLHERVLSHDRPKMKMATWMMALQCSAAASVAAADRTLTNGLVAASVSSDCALTAIHLAGGADSYGR
jgi:hypothetical protein